MNDLSYRSGSGGRQRYRSTAHHALRLGIEEFLFHEADLLDQRDFNAWLDLLAEDIGYFMPIRRNVPFGAQAARENTQEGTGISWFDEDKWTLRKRVAQIMTGVHYAEEPLSRVCHMVSNVQLLELPDDFNPDSVPEGAEVTIGCRFIVYQNRVEYETNLFVGKRVDTLRRKSDDWLIARREIILDQNILLAKSLSVFF